MGYKEDIQKCIDILKPLTDTLGLSEDDVKDMMNELHTTTIEE
ncbi:hypothetical protein [Lysinibacillus sphaericus]|nr:hypothetical protein [Lysinibacillus sphaericus]